MDFKFVVDIEDKKIDVEAGEAACQLCTGDKIIHDEGKLVREGKDVVDGLIEYGIDFSISDLIGMFIQTSVRLLGLSGEISQIQIVNPKVYLATPRHKVNIPFSILELDSFTATFESIIEMVEKMEKMAVMLKESSLFFVSDKHLFRKCLGRPSELHLKDGNDYTSWIGETYYFPSNDERSKSVLPEISCNIDFDVDGSTMKATIQGEKDVDYNEADVKEFVPTSDGKEYYINHEVQSSSRINQVYAAHIKSTMHNKGCYTTCAHPHDIDGCYSRLTLKDCCDKNNKRIQKNGIFSH